MAYNALECGVCNNGYSEEHCPRILPCSHTLCEVCIDEIILSQRRECPFCRKTFRANSSNDMMVIRSLLDAANQFSAMAIGSETSNGAETSPVKKLTKKGITNCIEPECQVLDVLEYLGGIKNHILDNNSEIDCLIQMLPNLKTFNNIILNSIERDTKLLENKMEVIIRESGKIKEFDAVIEAANLTSVGDIRDKTEGAYKLAKEKIKAIQDLLQRNQWGKVDHPEKYVEMMTTLRKVAEEIRETIKEPAVNITVNELKSLCDTSREIQRNIFAVKVTKGRKRVAPITIQSNNQATVGHMEEGAILPKSFVIEMNSLMRMTSRKAYLDLGVGEEYLGRIVISVIDEGNKAKNFLHMCAGDLGPSYINTRLLCVERKGRNGECVTAGRYEKFGGATSEAVMHGVDWEMESERDIYEVMPVVSGDVRGPINFDEAAEFDIYTRDSPSWRDGNHFGYVLEGLDILEDAIWKYSNINWVHIIDCGLVITV